jgi:hypothetical protein
MLTKFFREVAKVKLTHLDNSDQGEREGDLPPHGIAWGLGCGRDLVKRLLVGSNGALRWRAPRPPADSGSQPGVRPDRPER